MQPNNGLNAAQLVALESAAEPPADVGPADGVPAGAVDAGASPEGGASAPDPEGTADVAGGGGIDVPPDGGNGQATAGEGAQFTPEQLEQLRAAQAASEQFRLDAQKGLTDLSQASVDFARRSGNIDPLHLFVNLNVSIARLMAISELLMVGGVSADLHNMMLAKHCNAMAGTMKEPVLLGPGGRILEPN